MRIFVISIVLMFVFPSCNQQVLASDADINNAMSVVFGKMIYNNFGSIYLSDSFSKKLDKSTVYSDICEPKSDLSSSELEFMLKQYESNKGKSISNFVKNQDGVTLIDLNDDSTLETKKDKMIFEFGPPMYSLDYNEFIIYVFSTFIGSDGKRGWDDIYWHFEKEGDSWKLHKRIRRL